MSTGRFDGALPGNLQIRPKSGSSIWLSPGLRVTPAGVIFASATADDVSLSGKDLATAIADIRLGPGVGQNVDGAVHVSPGTIGTDKLGGVLSGDKGGTGRTGNVPGRFLAVSGSELTGIQEVSASPGGLSISSGSSLGVAGLPVLSAGELCARSALDLHRGSAPSIDEAFVAPGRVVAWTASDRDGDLVAVHARYAAPGATLSAEDVRLAPDETHSVDEGCYETVFVRPSADPFSPPHYDFFADEAGAVRLKARIQAGRRYRFERLGGPDHPFWVFGGFPVQGTAGRSHSSGIQAPGEFLQFEVPAQYVGEAAYRCTTHGSMVAEFAVRAASDPPTRDPVPLLSGGFDAGGVAAGTNAFVVAEDAAGNLSVPAVVALP